MLLHLVLSDQEGDPLHVLVLLDNELVFRSGEVEDEVARNSEVWQGIEGFRFLG
jgi:hypothetical protein